MELLLLQLVDNYEQWTWQIWPHVRHEHVLDMVYACKVAKVCWTRIWCVLVAINSKCPSPLYQT